jgi:hypothetical protein
MWIKQTIGEQRKVLADLFEPAMTNLAKQSIAIWHNLDKLDQILFEQRPTIPYAHLIYAIDKYGKQISSNVSQDGIDCRMRGQDLSRRPYSVSLYPKRHFTLSSVYISNTTGAPCMSAVQPVIDEQQFLGFIVADFDIRRLPLSVSSDVRNQPLRFWQEQHKSEIQKQVSKRVDSLLDTHVDEISIILNRLIVEHGIFHCTLHYSSGQAMLWHLDEPYSYHLYNTEQLLNPELLHKYQVRNDYAKRAVVSEREVKQVLEHFRTLRLADNKIYLRSGSINVINGMVGLTFSCDGSQYVAVNDFLDRNLSFWFTDQAAQA